MQVPVYAVIVVAVLLFNYQEMQTAATDNNSYKLSTLLRKRIHKKAGKSEKKFLGRTKWKKISLYKLMIIFQRNGKIKKIRSIDQRNLQSKQKKEGLEN